MNFLSQMTIDDGDGMWFYYADVIAWLEYFVQFFLFLLSNAIRFCILLRYLITTKNIIYKNERMNESNTHKFHSKNDEVDEIHIFFLYEKFDINFTLTAHSMNRE